jgi:hypothetical protein
MPTALQGWALYCTSYSLSLSLSLSLKSAFYSISCLLHSWATQAQSSSTWLYPTLSYTTLLHSNPTQTLGCIQYSTSEKSYSYLTHILLLTYPYHTHILPISYQYFTIMLHIFVPYIYHTLHITHPYSTYILPIYYDILSIFCPSYLSTKTIPKPIFSWAELVRFLFKNNIQHSLNIWQI